MNYERYSQIRDERKLKDSDVARMAGVTPSTFSNWKNGTCNPKIDKLQKISMALGINLEDFMGEPISKAQSTLLDLTAHSHFNGEDIEIMAAYHDADMQTKEMVKRILEYNRIFVETKDPHQSEQ